MQGDALRDPRRCDTAASARLETFLASLYVDSAARAAFLGDRLGTANAAGLTAGECASVLALDAGALELAARSFTYKRKSSARFQAQLRRRPHSWFLRVCVRLWARLSAR